MEQRLDIYEFGQGSPKVFFTAGLHGGEATGIFVAELMLGFLRANALLKGSVKLLPLGNPAAFRRMQRTSPYDELDLNRSFPGKASSTPTMALAEAIWQEAADADVIVDLHCCGVYNASYTLALCEEYPEAKELAERLSIPRIIQSSGAPGQLFTEACAKGVPAVIIELPGGGPAGVIDMDSAEECFEALVGLLRQYGMVEGEPNKPEPKHFDKLQQVAAEVHGLWLPRHEPGTMVAQGAVLGTLAGSEITSPVSGTTMMTRPPCYVFPGQPVIALAALK
jgi:predicted deacylase